MLTFGSTHCDFAGNIHVLTFGHTHCDFAGNIHVLTFGSTHCDFAGNIHVPLAIPSYETIQSPRGSW